MKEPVEGVEPVEVVEYAEAPTETDEQQRARLANDSRRVCRFRRQQFESNASRHWDKFYMRNGDKFFKDRHWTLGELADLLTPTSWSTGPFRLLECGCGVGNFVFPFVEQLRERFLVENNQLSLELFCCDFSSRAVEHVKDRARRLDEPIRPFLCDLTEPSCFGQQFPASYINFSTLIFVLSSVPPEKMDKVVENVRWALQVGGVVFVRDYGLNDHAQLRFDPSNKMDDNYYVRQDGTTSYFFSIETLNALFADGFQCLSCTYVRRTTSNRKHQISISRTFIQASYRKVESRSSDE